MKAEDLAIEKDLEEDLEKEDFPEEVMPMGQDMASIADIPKDLEKTFLDLKDDFDP